MIKLDFVLIFPKPSDKNKYKSKSGYLNFILKIMYTKLFLMLDN